MALSFMGNYEEIQHHRQHHMSHWKSVWQDPECSAVQWQHRRMVQNYSRSLTRVSILWPTLFNIFLEKIMCEALDDHEGSVSIGGWLITNFRFADDIVVNAEEDEEAGVLVDCLNNTTARYKMEMGSDKTKVMTNNSNGFQRESKIKGQRLEEVENFKYRWLSLSQSPGNQTKYFVLSVVWDSQFVKSFTLYMYTDCLDHVQLACTCIWKQRTQV